MLLKAIKTVRKVNQMRVAAIKKAEGVGAKHPDLADLLEIVKPITSIIESTVSMSVMPSVEGMETNMLTLLNLSQKKIYLPSYVNSLRICIFVCPICKHQCRNHGTADAHSCEEHSKVKYWPCSYLKEGKPSSFTSWNRDSYINHVHKHNK